MKKLTAIISLVALCFGAKAQESISIPLSEPSQPANVHFAIVTGSIQVLGYAGKEVIVTVEDSPVQAYKPVQREDGLKKINARQGFEIRAEEDHNTVRIVSSRPNQKMSIKVQVPVNANLKISTVNNGNVNVEHVSGSIEARNVNGSINMKEISGTVTANTVNGNVNVSFSKIENSPMAFTTVNGDIAVSLPANANVDVKVKSERGDIYSDFDIKLDETPQKVVISNEEGIKKITKDGYTVGSINNGGPELFMKNLNGKIVIRKNK